MIAAVPASEQPAQRRPSEIRAATRLADQPQRKHRPAPAAPNSRREREAPQPVAAEPDRRATASCARLPHVGGQAFGATAVTGSSHSGPPFGPDRRAACRVDERLRRQPAAAGRSATCGNSDIGTSVASTSPKQRAGHRDLVRNDFLVDIDERRGQHPAQQNRRGWRIASAAATVGGTIGDADLRLDQDRAARLPTNRARPARRPSPAPAAAAESKTRGRESPLRGASRSQPTIGSAIRPAPRRQRPAAGATRAKSAAASRPARRSPNSRASRGTRRRRNTAASRSASGIIDSSMTQAASHAF